MGDSFGGRYGEDNPSEGRNDESGGSDRIDSPGTEQIGAEIRGEILRTLLRADLKVDELEKELKKARQEKDTAEQAVVQLLVDSDLVAAETEEASFKIIEKSKAFVLTENKETFIDWIIKNEPGLLSVHYNTLNSWVKELIEKNLHIPQEIKVSKFHSISIRKKRASS